MFSKHGVGFSLRNKFAVGSDDQPVCAMAPKLYIISGSPPSCAVITTANTLGLNLDLKILDFEKGENRTPEYLKLNHTHTVPTLVDDDGFVIWESHAIMPYLISKYGKDDSLYPKDTKKRAIVDQRLHFETGVPFPLLCRILDPLMTQGTKTVVQKDIDSTNEMYSFVETFLEDNQWVAGDSVTIADYSLSTSIRFLSFLVKIDSSTYPKLVSWLEKVESLPAYHKKGPEEFAAFINTLL